MWYLLLLIAGFAPLIIGADILVGSASSLAKRLNVPTIVIGLTIVGFGTSSPEMVVNIFASLQGKSSIVLGNVIGSNIFNVLGILGISALIYPVLVKDNTTWIEIPLALLSAVAVMILANDALIDKTAVSGIGRIDGAVLLLFFVIFLVYNINLALSGNYSGVAGIKERSLSVSVFLIIAGFILLVIGGRMIVVSAVEVAEFLGLDQRVIALTIVSIGTSLPELATSIVAALKKNPDIAIGNIVGSNIFNVFFILGLSAVINPVAVPLSSNIDLWVNLMAGAFLFIFILAGNGRKLSRLEGGVLVGFYLAYIITLLIK